MGHENSSVLWSTLGQILKILKKILGQTLKSQVKKEVSHPLKICNYKKEPYK